jgi:hypothetical protein
MQIQIRLIVLDKFRCGAIGVSQFLFAVGYRATIAWRGRAGSGAKTSGKSVE